MSKKIEEAVTVALDEISKFVLDKQKVSYDAGTFMRWNEVCFQMCCAEREAEYIRRLFVPFVELAKRIDDKKRRYRESVEYIKQHRIYPGIVKDMNNLIAEELELASNNVIARDIANFHDMALHIQRACSYISRYYLPNQARVGQVIVVEISENRTKRVVCKPRLDDMIHDLLPPSMERI